MGRHCCLYVVKVIDLGASCSDGPYRAKPSDDVYEGQLTPDTITEYFGDHVPLQISLDLRLIRQE